MDDIDQPRVCISGLGGSGTRVYAEIVRQAGIDIGKDINPENDNLLFTRLFKDPSWYISKGENEFKERLDLFKTLSLGKPITENTENKLKDIFKQNQCYKTPLPYDFSKLLRKTPISQYGWKEPNSHIFLEELGIALPKCKFLFIIRDGLEMSLSRNMQQLNNWGKILFDLNMDLINEQRSHLQLKYWFLANQRAIKIGNDSLQNRFLVCQFHDIYTNPEIEIQRILNFLELEVSSEDIASMAMIPQKPSSAGRYTQNFLNLDKEELALVRSTNQGVAIASLRQNTFFQTSQTNLDTSSMRPNDTML